MKENCTNYIHMNTKYKNLSLLICGVFIQRIRRKLLQKVNFLLYSNKRGKYIGINISGKGTDIGLPMVCGYDFYPMSCVLYPPTVLRSNPLYPMG